jgi:hypothetical protein
MNSVSEFGNLPPNPRKPTQVYAQPDAGVRIRSYPERNHKMKIREKYL